MGKVLDVLRQTGPHSTSRPADEPEIEMPYIEIGPRRSVTGSPEVLAGRREGEAITRGGEAAFREGEAPAEPRAITPTGPSPFLREDRPGSAGASPSRAPASPPRAPASPPRVGHPHGVQFRSLAPARPASRFAPELVAYHAPDSDEAAGYAKVLGAALAAAGEGKVLLFAGSRDGAGTTTVVLNAAIAAARQGRWALVIDGNLRRPAVAARLGLEAAPGLMDVLAGECALEQALLATGQERLLAMPAGRAAPLLADAESPRALVKNLAGRFDVVLIDAPAWGDGRAALLLATAADAAFLVAPAGEADGPPASELLAALPARGVRLAGCVLAGG